GSFTVNAAALNNFTVSNPGTQTAGVAFSETVTALDLYGNAPSGWTSASKCVAFSGAANSPNSTAPSYPAAAGCGVGNSSLSFNASGVASASVTLFNAASTTLTVTSVDTPAGKTGSSGSFTVNAAALDHFTLSNPGAQTAGVSFSETVTALDLYG